MAFQGARVRVPQVKLAARVVNSMEGCELRVCKRLCVGNIAYHCQNQGLMNFPGCLVLGQPSGCCANRYLDIDMTDCG